jgi:hypothetical protein
MDLMPLFMGLIAMFLLLALISSVSDAYYNSNTGNGPKPLSSYESISLVRKERRESNISNINKGFTPCLYCGTRYDYNKEHHCPGCGA